MSLTLLFRHHVPLAAAVVSAAALLAAGVPATAHAQEEITVDTTSDVVDFGGEQAVADLPGPDGRTSLHEAVIAATNTNGPDMIGFAIPTSAPGFDGNGFTIRHAPSSEAEQLTLGDDATTIDATTQPGGYPITVLGSEQTKASGLDGLVIKSSGNTVKGLGWHLYSRGIFVAGGSDNLITDVTVRDSFEGVEISAYGRPSSADNALTDSTIAGNDSTAVDIWRSQGSAVVGNTITDNGGKGVVIHDTPNVTVSDNLISGNAIGIRVWRFDSSGNATGNTITNNRRGGVVVGVAGFTISRNSIAGNSELGINLLTARNDEFGVSRNHKGGYNYPEHLTAVDKGDTTVVEGRIRFYPEPQSVTIELFTNDVADPSGHGEGQTFVGTVTPNDKGRFTATLPGGLAGQYVTATATAEDGTTSEFSEAVLVEPAKKHR